MFKLIATLYIASFFSQKLALYTCQRAIRNMQMAKSWPWMQIWMMIKPNLK